MDSKKVTLVVVVYTLRAEVEVTEYPDGLGALVKGLKIQGEVDEDFMGDMDALHRANQLAISEAWSTYANKLSPEAVREPVGRNTDSETLN